MTYPTVLSILMATTPDRNGMFTNLYNEVMRQVTYCHTTHPSLGRIEVLVDDSKRFLDGGLSIGGKRQALLDRATGSYVCYLDSDEEISPNYVEVLIRLCQHNADCCTFKNLTKTESFWIVVNMSIHFPNDQVNPLMEVRRNCWHVCPIKTSFAKLYRFEDSNYGEDETWVNNVRKHITTEAHTDAIIHCYRHGKHSEADKITNYENTERAT